MAPPLDVFVSNIHFTMSERLLNETLTAQCGEIAAIKLSTDRENGRSKGFGWVLFGDAASRQRALALNEKIDYNGRLIRISTNKGGRVSGPAGESGVALNPRELTGRLTNPAHDTLALFEQHGDIFDSINLVTAMYRLAKKGVTRSVLQDRRFAALHAKLEGSDVESFTPHEVRGPVLLVAASRAIEVITAHNIGQQWSGIGVGVHFIAA